MSKDKFLYNIIRKLAVILLTIVVNQQGELVPYKTDVIKMLDDILNMLNDKLLEV